MPPKIPNSSIGVGKYSPKHVIPALVPQPLNHFSQRAGTQKSSIPFALVPAITERIGNERHAKLLGPGSPVAVHQIPAHEGRDDECGSPA